MKIGPWVKTISLILFHRTTPCGLWGMSSSVLCGDFSNTTNKRNHYWDSNIKYQMSVSLVQVLFQLQGGISLVKINPGRSEIIVVNGASFSFRLQWTSYSLERSNKRNWKLKNWSRSRLTGWLFAKRDREVEIRCTENISGPWQELRTAWTRDLLIRKPAAPKPLSYASQEWSRNWEWQLTSHRTELIKKPSALFSEPVLF